MQALTSQRSLEMALDHPPPPATQLCCAWALAHVREYVHVVHALAPNALIAHRLRPLWCFTIFIHWLKLTSPLLSMIFIQSWILFWI